MSCDDVKVGGTVGAASITGGRSISDYAVTVIDYTALWGTVGKRAGSLPVIGQPGTIIAGAELPKERLLTLNLFGSDLPAAGGVGSVTDLWANQDDLTSLFTDSGGVILEWVLPSESRWLRVWGLTGAAVSIRQKFRRLSLPLVSAWPYWRSDTLQSAVVDGAAVAVAIGGTTERVYDPKLVFSADGTFTDDTSGLAITIAGSANAVTVERDSVTGRWTATEAGSPVPGKVTVSDSRWIFLTRGGTFTSTVSVTVSWRDQWE